MKFAYPVPINTPVTQDFAAHVLAAKVNHWTNYNGGIDWAVASGTPIVAAQAGTVTAVRRDATGYGNHVRIQHDESYVTIYGHMMDFAVKVGDKVKAGQVIGRSDNTGNSTGPHLHFELRKGSTPIDPAPLLIQEMEPSTPPAPVPSEPGETVYIQPFYNLRAGPGANTVDLGTTDATIQAEVIQRQGDWLQLRLSVWVHKDGVQG